MEAQQENRPEPDCGRQPGEQDYRKEVQISIPTQSRKWRRVLEAFVAGRSFNRFEAERELHDHCLHSTVSVLQKRGVTIHRQEEIVPGWAGIPTRVMRYWLAEESRRYASAILGLDREQVTKEVRDGQV